ncbi:DUF86 domain-containing protein [Candidatus Saganbacteria bacterium]|nr:DUF86 domain-containing protein [Candidatus Saganbacteria bacterium]
MVDTESIATRFKHLKEYLKVLNELKRIKKNIFIDDYHYFGLAERYLQLSIECMLDVGNMLIVSLDLRKPSDKQEVIDILEEVKIVPSILATRLSGIARFRNLLVHEYVKIDRSKVYNILNSKIPELEAFMLNITKYLKKKRYI